jgi:conjugal transfer pilus assembly protein TraK
MKIRAGWLALCLAGALTPAQAEAPPVAVVGGVSLPGVVPTVGIEGARSTIASRGGDVGSPVAQTAPETSDSNISITVSPGATELVRIAAGYLNRIETPFENPKLLSVNPLEVQKEGSSLYVATTSERPVGVHVLSNDSEDSRSISLTLIPARIPPRTVTLKWPDSTPEWAGALSNGKAKRWEESTPYEEKLLELVQGAAQGKVPDGYTMSERTSAVPCALAGVKFVTGQRLSGSHFSLFVLRATNTSRSTIEISRSGGCDFGGVVVVAPWPRAYLEPGASTELYVGVENSVFEPRAVDRVRPSLLTH